MKKNKQKKNDSVVSVIVPTYNRSTLLNDAIYSVLAQSYRSIECIVVDDGSIDNTREVVNELMKNNSDSFIIKYIYQQNSGSQVARNTGTTVASGEFIQYLDSDDLLYPEKISIQVNYLKDNPDCDAVFGDWDAGTKEKSEKVIAHKSDDFIKQFLTERCIANFAMLMRKDLINKIGDWDVNIKRNQEIDFHLRGVLAGGKFEYLAASCGLWRIHNAERIANSTSFSSAISFYNKWEGILEEKNLWEKGYKIGVNMNYMWFLANYPLSSGAETKKLLLEMMRLQPEHQNFSSFKFKFCRFLLGKNLALDFWISRYKKRQLSNK